MGWTQSSDLNIASIKLVHSGSFLYSIYILVLVTYTISVWCAHVPLCLFNQMSECVLARCVFQFISHPLALFEWIFKISSNSVVSASGHRPIRCASVWALSRSLSRNSPLACKGGSVGHDQTSIRPGLVIYILSTQCHLITPREGKTWARGQPWLITIWFIESCLLLFASLSLCIFLRQCPRSKEGVARRERGHHPVDLCALVVVYLFSISIEINIRLHLHESGQEQNRKEKIITACAYVSCWQWALCSRASEFY